jgi:hypothetical protein
MIPMTTRNRRDALAILEQLSRGPLTLGKLVRAIREGEEWSLAAMAGRLRVTRAHVAAIERGKAVSPERAARYARVQTRGQSGARL